MGIRSISPNKRRKRIPRKPPQGGAWQLLWEVNRSQGARDYSPYRTLCCSSAGVWQPPRYRRHITIQDRRAGGVVKSNYSGHRRPFRCRGFATPRNPSNIPAPFAQTGTGRGWAPRALKSAPMTGCCAPGAPSLALPSGGCESRRTRKQPRRKTTGNRRKTEASYKREMQAAQKTS